MLHRPTREVAAPSPAALDERYRRALAAAVRETEDRARLAAATGVDQGVLGALARDEDPSLTVDAAARVLGSADRWPAAPAIAAGAREKLLVGAITAVVDAEDVAAAPGVDLPAEGVRRRLTGAEPATLSEFVALEAFLAEASE